MKFTILFFILFFNFFSVNSYIPQETLFDQAYIHGFSNGISSDVLFVKGLKDFAEKVLSNEKPVVVKVFSKNQNRFIKSIYKDIAQTFKNKVSFVSMDVDNPENFNVIKSIMEPLGIETITVPFFLFFKQRTLVLPPKLLPKMSGFVTKDFATKIKEKFIEYIKEQFFSKSLNLKDKNKFFVLKEVGTKGELTWKKLEKFSEKMKKWLVGLQNISRKEVRAWRKNF